MSSQKSIERASAWPPNQNGKSRVAALCDLALKGLSFVPEARDPTRLALLGSSLLSPSWLVVVVPRWGNRIVPEPWGRTWVTVTVQPSAAASS